MAYTPFDQSTRDAYWAQADDQAKRLGISREQGLYNIARANNVGNADVDTLMGFGAGTTDNWLKQRDTANAATHQNTIYAGLSNNSSAADIAGAYREWSGANGGDTADNQRAAEGYLSSLGIGRGSILDAYTAYKGQSGASGGATGGGVGGAPSAAQPQPPRGIVESAMSQTLPTAGPTHWSVSPEMTVQGQLRTVMDSNSPLMQQARTQGLQVANERGLLNSSIAESAAMDSMYKAALPIATPDAATYANAAQTEYQTAANEWGAQQEFGRTTQRDATQQGYTQSNMTQQQGYNMQTLGAQQTFQQAQSALDRTQQATMLDKQAAIAKDVAGIEAMYKNLTQGSASAASIVTKMQDALSLITANKDITDPAKRDAAIADVKANAAEALALIGAMSGDLDLREYVQAISTSAAEPVNQLQPAAPVAW